MEKGPKILVIEDEPEIRRFLRASLGMHGYQLSECATAREGLAEATALRPDLVLLDLGLPDVDGLEVIANLRGWTQVPIIVVSARGREADKVRALDAGADDYLTKPFGIGELLARVRATLRRTEQREPTDSAPVFELGALRVDFEKHQVQVGERQVHLTPIEFRLLTALVKSAGKVITHRQLLKDVWGPDSVLETHYLRVYMTHLRRKIEADPAQPKFLLTEPGIGYRLADGLSLPSL